MPHKKPMAIMQRLLNTEEPSVTVSIRRPTKKPAVAPYHSPKNNEIDTTKGRRTIGDIKPISNVKSSLVLKKKRTKMSSKFI